MATITHSPPRATSSSLLPLVMCHVAPHHHSMIHNAPSPPYYFSSKCAFQGSKPRPGRKPRPLCSCVSLFFLLQLVWASTSWIQLRKQFYYNTTKLNTHTQTYYMHILFKSVSMYISFIIWNNITLWWKYIIILIKFTKIYLFIYIFIQYIKIK